MGPLIGSGNFGSVYEAKCKKTGNIFAVKKIPRYNSKSYKIDIREHKILAKMHHANIVKMEEFFKTENNIYIVMEKLQTSLDDYL